MPESDPTTLVVPTTAISTPARPGQPERRQPALRRPRRQGVPGRRGHRRAAALRRRPRAATRSASLGRVGDRHRPRRRHRRRDEARADHDGRPPAARRARCCPASTGWSRPQFTRFGELWALGRQGGGSGCGASSTASQAVVTAPELEGRDITAFQLLARRGPDRVRRADRQADRGSRSPGSTGATGSTSRGCASSNTTQDETAAADPAEGRRLARRAPTCSCSASATARRPPVRTR